MRVFSIIFQWVVVIAFGLLIYWQMNPELSEPDYNPDLWDRWGGFSAISYSSIDSSGVTVELFEQHLEALRAAGYQCITPADASRFLRAESALPEKAILIMIEDGRLESFMNITPSLRTKNAIATMMVPVQRTRRLFDGHMKSNDLKRAAAMNNWNIGSMGDRAFNTVLNDDSGKRGPFLTTFEWDPRAGLEAEEEYIARVEDDYRSSAAFLSRITSQGVPAYLYPYADSGQGQGSYEGAYAINHQMVAKHYEIAFDNASSSYNGLHRDPYRLGRLRVYRGITAEELISRLEASRPSPPPAPPLLEPHKWEIHGLAGFGTETLLLTERSTAWLNSSDEWDNFQMQIKYSARDSATFGLVGRHSAFDWNVRIMITPEKIFLQELLGDRTVTIEEAALEFEEDRDYTLSFTVKQNRAWVELDGEPVISAAPLSPHNRYGRFGIFSETGVVTVKQIVGDPLLPIVMKMVPGELTISRETLADCSYISIPLTLSEIVNFSDELKNLLFLAAQEGIQTMIEIVGEPADSEQEEAIIVNRLLSTLENESLRVIVSRVLVDEDATSLASALRDKGFPVGIKVSAAKSISFLRDGKLGADDYLLVGSRADEIVNLNVERLFHYVSAERLMISNKIYKESSDNLFGVHPVIDLSDNNVESGIEN
jgi:hypothetical protein